jgi:UDP-N-acetylmuramyl tripeptide synthase
MIRRDRLPSRRRKSARMRRRYAARALAHVQGVPQAWDGRARFMVANVLAAVAAARALGVQVSDVRDALTPRTR